MVPRLATWCRSKDDNDRLIVAGELTERAICLCMEPAGKFMKAVEEASVYDAMFAVLSYKGATMRFYKALSKWCELHTHEEGAYKLSNVRFNLKNFYEKTQA